MFFLVSNGEKIHKHGTTTVVRKEDLAFLALFLLWLAEIVCWTKARSDGCLLQCFVFFWGTLV